MHFGKIRLVWLTLCDAKECSSSTTLEVRDKMTLLLAQVDLLMPSQNILDLMKINTFHSEPIDFPIKLIQLRRQRSQNQAIQDEIWVQGKFLSSYNIHFPKGKINLQSNEIPYKFDGRITNSATPKQVQISNLPCPSLKKYATSPYAPLPLSISKQNHYHTSLSCSLAPLCFLFCVEFCITLIQNDPKLITTPHSSALINQLQSQLK